MNISYENRPHHAEGETGRLSGLPGKDNRAEGDRSTGEKQPLRQQPHDISMTNQVRRVKVVAMICSRRDKTFQKGDIVKFNDTSGNSTILRVDEDSSLTRGMTKAQPLAGGPVQYYTTIHLFSDRDCFHARMSAKQEKIETAQKIGFGKPRRRG